MTKAVRIILAVFAVIMIACAGLAAGYFLRDVELQKPNIETDALKIQKEVRAPNHKTYVISPPSRGKAIKKVSLPLAKGLEGILDATVAADIKLGQTAILYGADGTPMNALAMVSEIFPYTQETREFVKITLFVHSGKMADTPPVRADIVTDRMTDAERLPLSALVTKDGEPYLWEIANNPDGTASAYLKRTNLLLECNGMAIVRTPTSKSNVFILDPDGNLRDGDKINTREDYYSGNEYTDDEIVLAEIETRYPPPLRPDPYVGPEFECGIQYRNDPAVAQGTTVPRRDIAEDFINKIHELSKKDAAAKAAQ